jgi:hypothetical protein
MQVFSVYDEEGENFCDIGIPHHDDYMDDVFYCPFCGSEDLDEHQLGDEDEDE